MSNKIISDYRSEALQGSIKLVDDKGNEKICIGMKPIMISNQWAPAKVKKGDIITMDDKDYRVLKVNKDIATVMSMYFVETAFSKSGAAKSVKYEGSLADTYCETTFYNSLSSAIRNAIIPTNITQDQYNYEYGSDNDVDFDFISSYVGTYLYRGSPLSYTMYLIDSDYYKNTISRNCYVISVSEIIEYLETTPQMTFETTTLTYENVYIMLLNNATGFDYGKSVYFRSLYTYSNTDSIYGTGFFEDGRLGTYDDFAVAKSIQPVFQIDLSKVDYAIL